MNIKTWQQIVAIIGLSLITCSEALCAANVNVGGQIITIPAPESFSQAITPRMIKFGELSTIPEDRLLAVFGPTSEVEKEARSGIFQSARYGFAQATRNVEPHQIPLDRFAKYKADTKSELLGDMSANDRVEIQKNHDLMAKWIQSGMGTKIQFGEPKLGAILIIDESPTSLTMITKMIMPVSSGKGKPKPVEMVVGMSQMLVKSKVIWIQVYSGSTSRADSDWVTRTIVKWTLAVQAANP
ncbi:hypothetical protein [Undibacterium sp.]|uniref:hypothetical protein n=1 Tax=Undibacterium sp. TaxID=1914977 RepID=UPI002C87088A|nr:hypothetical protein [Undibacterium sp.]HTD02730.1 hypothetical protein [Undibacterium sp.]